MTKAKVPAQPTPDDAEGASPLTMPIAQELDTQWLPGWIGDYVEAVALQYSVSKLLVWNVVQSQISLALAGKARVRLTPAWREEINTWLLCVSPSGTLKSAVITEIMAPLRQHMAELEEQNRPAVARAERKKKALEKELSSLHSARAKLDPRWSSRVRTGRRD